LMQEEAQMASMEWLKMTHDVDGKVIRVDGLYTVNLLVVL